MENEKFLEAVKNAPKLNCAPTNDEKGMLYGLYKQATVCNINIPAPGFFDFAGGAKWKAWNEMNGKFQEQAKVEYVDLVATLISKYGPKIEIFSV